MVACVVIGTEEQAEAAMESCVVEDYQRHKWHYNNSSVDHLFRCYWHIHTVVLVVAEGEKGPNHG